MANQTALHDRHVAAGARMVDFGGWDMPLHYGSQIDEHHVVRKSAGIFDVSHMTVVDVTGEGARDYLAHLLANNIDKLTEPGRGLYSCMLNEDGGVVDDLIAYRVTDRDYRLVVNAATREQDLAWMQKNTGSISVELRERPELMMLAVQGPEARRLVAPLMPESLAGPAMDLGSFGCVDIGGWFAARTGYTGEDGWEIILDREDGLRLWDDSIAAGVSPCGLGARDTLRLEAGLNLYGQDMDQATSPLVSGLGWTVGWSPEERDFIGRSALEKEKSLGSTHKFVGLILDDRGIMRHGQRVITDAGDGVVTSGGFSPTIQCSVALARVPAAADGTCQVEIRNAVRNARIVKPPFVRKGVAVI
jgi:aminomethyltransferase